jgi:hypothetical protein
MNLSVRERLILGVILPAQGDFTTLKLVRKLREDLSFSEDEHKLLKFRDNPEKTATMWDMEGERVVGDKEFTIGEKATDVIVVVLKALNDAKPPKLTMDHMSLYEKFIESAK